MAAAIASFRNRIIPYVSGCPFPAIDRAVCDAIRQFCTDTKILKKTFEELEIDYTTIDATDSDAVTIDLTTYFTGYEPIKVIGGQIDGTDYFFKELDLSNDNSNIEDIKVDYTFFYNFPTATSLKLFPFTSWGADFDAFIELAVMPNDGTTSFDDLFFNKWRRGIVALASSELQRIPDKNWTDLNQAQINMGIYDTERSKANFKIRNETSKRRRPVITGYI